jgi:hypothetical protein
MPLAGLCYPLFSIASIQENHIRYFLLFYGGGSTISEMIYKFPGVFRSIFCFNNGITFSENIYLPQMILRETRGSTRQRSPQDGTGWDQSRWSADGGTIRDDLRKYGMGRDEQTWQTVDRTRWDEQKWPVEDGTRRDELGRAGNDGTGWSGGDGTGRAGGDSTGWSGPRHTFTGTGTNLSYRRDSNL